ncbi:unnamed protein product [Amoebophrya sp. A25]|nr:unnamed protein product [Amoebophrya sp. A25]|eukprot:GSA25T00018109001.1
MTHDIGAAFSDEMNVKEAKNVYCIRHGISLHNVLYERAKTRDVYYTEEVHDSPLLRQGHLEAQAFGEKWGAKNTVDVAFVSTSSRALMTLSNIWRKEIQAAGFAFPESWGKSDYEDGRLWNWTEEVKRNPLSATRSEELRDILREKFGIGFYATDHLREFAMGIPANLRKTRKELEILYPWIDFSFVEHNEDFYYYWTLDASLNGGFEPTVYSLKEQPRNGTTTQESENIANGSSSWAKRAAKRQDLVMAKPPPFDSPEDDCGSEYTKTEGAGVVKVLIESEAATGERCRRFKHLVLTDPIAQRAKQIAVVAHSGILGLMMFGRVPLEKEQLEHAYPYEYRVDQEGQSAEVPYEKWGKIRFIS